MNETLPIYNVLMNYTLPNFEVDFVRIDEF
jgi:hypothetical protein